MDVCLSPFLRPGQDATALLPQPRVALKYVTQKYVTQKFVTQKYVTQVCKHCALLGNELFEESDEIYIQEEVILTGFRE